MKKFEDLLKQHKPATPNKPDELKADILGAMEHQLKHPRRFYHSKVFISVAASVLLLLSVATAGLYKISRRPITREDLMPCVSSGGRGGFGIPSIEDIADGIFGRPESKNVDLETEFERYSRKIVLPEA